MSDKKTRIPPVYYCHHCEPHVKFDGLRAGSKAQFVDKRCSLCAIADAEAKTGADR